MPSPRLRAHARKHDFPIPLEEEVAMFMADGTIRTDLYAWKVCRYLLPISNRGTSAVRASIQLARDTETALWRRYPSGPAHSLPDH